MNYSIPRAFFVVATVAALVISSAASATIGIAKERQAPSEDIRRLQTYTASDNFQAAMLNAVNAERAKLGLTPFCTNKKLQAAAQLHSDDQARNNFMSHTGSGGSTVSMRITAQGFVWSSIAENVAAGQVDVASVMTAWMNSAGHKANILGSYKFFGTGYAYNSASTYKHYWTQDFGVGANEACDSNATPAPTAAVTPTPGLSIQTQMLNAVNAERAAKGLTPFCTSKKLQTAAQLHSEDQATNNFVSGVGSNGSQMSARITAQGFVWTTLAENIAAGQVDVVSVVKAWMNSDGHRANILGNYQFFGMGYAYNVNAVYKYYWTQDFGASTQEVCGGGSTTTLSPTVTPAPTSAPTPTPITGLSIQAQMLNAVNAERAKLGLTPFCTNKKIQAASQLHSQDQATNNFMSHTGSNGSNMGMRITAQGFVWSSIAENVAAGQVDVASVMTSWMNSAGHKANILGDYKFFGMGYAYNANAVYKHYWTQDFGVGANEVCA